MTVMQELQQVLGTTSTDPEVLASGAHKLTDDQWDQLSNRAQDWANDFSREVDAAVKQHREANLPALEGATVVAGNGIAGFIEQPEQVRTRRFRSTAGSTIDAVVVTPKNKAAKSEEQRAKISAAMKKRWAAKRAAEGKPAKVKAKAQAKKVTVLVAKKPVAPVASNGAFLRINKAGNEFRIEKVSVETIGIAYNPQTAALIMDSMKAAHK